MRGLLLILSLFICVIEIQAQKEGNVWVFGINAGIDFNDTATPAPFAPEVRSFEVSGSIADSNGKLLFYISDWGLSPQFNAKSTLNNGSNIIIENGDSISLNPTTARGIAIIPTKKHNEYLVLYASMERCQYNCFYLVHALINMNSNGGLGKVIYKDSLLLDQPIEEGIAAVKHANGNDWWIIGHMRRESLSEPCNQSYYRLLISEGNIFGPYFQRIGELHCSETYGAGEPNFSSKGNKLSYVSFDEKFVSVYDFNRCTGELLNYRALDPSGTATYSAEFSPSARFLYVTRQEEVLIFGTEDATDRIFQYDLDDNNNTSNRREIWNDGSHSYLLGQLELASNNKIYISYSSLTNLPIDSLNNFNNRLSVINSPDSLGVTCDIQPFSFQLALGSMSRLNLPNMPNYNLGPLSIYQADAGADSIVFCTDSTVKGIRLGTDSVSGVAYQWSPNIGLDNDTIAQPILFPEESRWYYVNLTDTTITNACQSRTDSVYVEVRECYTSVKEPYQDDKTYTLHPNLIKGEFVTSIQLSNTEQGTIEFYSLTGTHIDETEIIPGTNNLYLNPQRFSNGIYLYKVYINGQAKHKGKLVIVR